MTTNYENTFIAVSPDTKALVGTDPKAGTIASEQLSLLHKQPYGYTSDELLFAVHAERNGVQQQDWSSELELFVSKPRACLRASSLVKQYGWGLHHDTNAKVAAYGVGTDDYRRLLTQSDLKQTVGMRTKRS